MSDENSRLAFPKLSRFDQRAETNNAQVDRPTKHSLPLTK